MCLRSPQEFQPVRLGLGQRLLVAVDNTCCIVFDFAQGNEALSL
jgi:hypothetical protein